MSIAWFIVITFVIVTLHIYIYHRWGLARIDYDRSFSEKSVFEGEDIEMIDEISNKKILPLPWLRLESSMNEHLVFKQQSKYDNTVDHGSFHRTLFSLMPYQKIRRRQSLTCAKRGLYHFKTVALSTGDVFGFSESFNDFSSPAEIVVYPRLMELDDIPLPVHSWMGDITVKRWIMEDPFLKSGIREYAFGDPMNEVNWKATARTNRLQVNKNEYTADHDLMIYVNFNQTGDVWRPISDEGLMEKALSYAATIAEHCVANGIQTGFGCNGYRIDDSGAQSIRIEPENSKQQLTYIFETMARLKIDSKESIHTFLDEDIDNLREGTDILLITAIMTDEIREKIEKLESLGNAVEVLVLESDAEKAGA
ncbi:MAG TPA: DUF58 domain-containing protein [Bacillota bacterium]|nr:DUF58 domain-containing protein [Bacillota bacterium]